MFVDSMVGVKDKLTSLSATNLRSIGGTDEKFVNYNDETLPLIGSSNNLYSIQSEYRREGVRGFIIRHRKKLMIGVSIMLVLYIFIAIFCGLKIDHCAS